MKLRHKKHGRNCHSGSFNTHSLNEIIVYGDEDCDSDYITNYDVLLPDMTWKDLAQAFKDRDVVPNNMNTTFYYPIDEECKQRGYNP